MRDTIVLGYIIDNISVFFFVPQIFDQEIMKRSKECALALERSASMFTSKQDKFHQYWQIC